MKINFGFVMMSFVFLLSCGDKKKAVPHGLLNEKQMTSVMVDMQLADAMVLPDESKKDDNEKMQAQLYLSVLNKHHTTNKVFSDSWDYYLHTPEKMDTVYQQVINTLTQMQLDGGAPTQHVDTLKKKLPQMPFNPYKIKKPKH